MAKTKTPRPIKQPVSPWVYGLGTLILIFVNIGILFLFQPKGMDKAVLYLVVIINALFPSFALFGFMHSFARQKTEIQKQTKTRKKRIVRELVGPVVLFLILLTIGINWISGIDDSEPFTFTIFLKDANGKTVLKNRGEIILTLGNEKKSRRINEDGGADFKGISPTFRDQDADVELIVGGWQFKHGTTSTNCKIKDNNATLIIKRDNSLCCLTGKVVDEEGNFIEGAKATIRNTSVKTNANGWFKLEIPPEEQAVEQSLTIQKKGYIIHRETLDVRGKSEVLICLYKKREQ